MEDKNYTAEYDYTQDQGVDLEQQQLFNNFSEDNSMHEQNNSHVEYEYSNSGIDQEDLSQQQQQYYDMYNYGYYQQQQPYYYQQPYLYVLQS